VIAGLSLQEEDIVLGSALVNMYAKCGLLSKAREVLEELPMRDAISWSAIISGYAEEGKTDEALNCFEQMRKEGLYPDMVTFLSMLKACGRTCNIDKGKENS
jgi:pentatricopeptide repeat protein